MGDLYDDMSLILGMFTVRQAINSHCINQKRPPVAALTGGLPYAKCRLSLSTQKMNNLIYPDDFTYVSSVCRVVVS